MAKEVAIVFLIGDDEQANLNQMIEAVTRDGYCIVQEYLPAAADGDVRLFVMNGRALWHEGKFAAFRRVNDTGDARSNVHSGGKCVPAEVTDNMLQLVEMVPPKLVRDGMFLVGLDVVDDKRMEINVLSPGGWGGSQQHSGVDFCRPYHPGSGEEGEIQCLLRMRDSERRSGDTVNLSSIAKADSASPAHCVATHHPGRAASTLTHAAAMM